MPKKANAPAPREKSLEEQLEYQKKLNNIANRIHSASDTNDILLNLQSEILSLFKAYRITVYVVDGIKREIVSRFKSGEEIGEIRVPINPASISGYCAASGKLVNIGNVYDDNELKRISSQLQFDKSWDEKTGFKTTQVLAAPISYNRYLLGVIQLINKKGGKSFTKEDGASVLDIAKVLGTAFFKNQKAAQKIKPTRFDYLIMNNIISNKDLASAMPRARKAKESVESVLMSDFSVSKDDIGKSLANFYNTRFIPYSDKMMIPGELLEGLKVGFLRTNAFVPVAQSDGKVIVAMENPNYLPARDAVKRIIKAKEFEYCVSLKDDIYEMIDLFFDIKRGDLLSESGSIEDILGQLETGEDDFEDDTGGMDEEDSAIVQLVNKMIVDAYNRGASDIHVEPRHGKANALIRIRIDGACQLYQTLPYTYKRAIVSRIKIMSDLDIAERRLPQDGKIKFKKYAPLDIELRVATIPTAGQNEDVVMRLLSTGEPLSLDAMGMSERNYKEFIDIIIKPYGIVLVVGPTGSGKTTTLHAALGYINKPETKIWTAEDPVEITQDGLRQVQVLPKIGFDFATAMRAFLRADPDVIMVGEMRDHETVSTGIEASLTGHLVLSTLHTNSAPETITRLLDMGMDPFNFADALLGVLGQRLVRTLCKDCKEKFHPDRKEYDALVRAYDGDFDALGYEYNDDFFLYRPKGCDKCGNTGYRGRTGIYELLVGTDDIKSLIQGRAKMENIRGQAIKDGMTTLMQDGIRKICLGQTDLAQVRRVCIR
ncbi:MAG: GspE/PulE family protein [Deltaproteobacteria bacterium]|nr:GspE/PulE family protein [Deltaproteobacteria bacterium]MBW1736098.1 GspE/PulE family protein [Deltaproteobacteria bacterium]MBW1908379.1 GspE/PulE family protein [Deltaproteobacteria bacterium]MBW2032429.1 GspE/PulE family protein [Deltaproteobacteria bacterium]MBW2113464.1 GspE/PulE family protein [Deltaproteobacteria bacterium]